jgi:hypothetical protein
MYHRELRTVLMLLSFSTRSMTIQEVAEATAVDLEEQPFTTDNQFGDPFDLLEVCSSLVSLTDVPGGTSSQLRYEDMYQYTPTPRTINVSNSRISPSRSICWHPERRSRYPLRFQSTTVLAIVRSRRYA